MAQIRAGNSDAVAEALRHAAAELGRDLSRTAQDTRRAAQDIAKALNHTIGDAAAEQTREVGAALGKSLKQHPVTWLVSAASVGGLITLIATQRRERL
jgi:hypothetical protein